MVNKDSFVIHKAFYDPIRDLSDVDMGKLFHAIFKQQVDGIELEKSSPVYMAYQFFSNQFRVNEKKYLRVVERNKTNGSKGGRPEKPNKPSGLKKNQITQSVISEPKQADKISKDKIREEKKIKHAFSDSVIFDKQKFKEAFPTWNKLKLNYYYNAADGWSTEGNKKINWIKTIENWDRRDATEGRLRFPDDVTVSDCPHTADEIRIAKTQYTNGGGMPSWFNKKYESLLKN